MVLSAQRRASCLTAVVQLVLGAPAAVAMHTRPSGISSLITARPGLVTIHVAAEVVVAVAAIIAIRQRMVARAAVTTRVGPTRSAVVRRRAMRVVRVARAVATCSGVAPILGN